MVSVVIPCYNQAHFLRDAIESVRAQTYKDWEIIVVDDGSPDDTYKVCKSLGVKCIRKNNGGLSSARNAGINEAKGEYILPLDADDKIHPLLLETVLPAIQEADIISTWLVTFGNENRSWGSQHLRPGLNMMYKQNQINCCSLYRKSMWHDVGGYDEGMKDGYEDWDFWLSSLEAGYTIKVIPEHLFFYRKHSVSMLRDARKKHEQIIQYMRLKRTKADKLVDVVIPMGTGSQSGDNELRFCLRAIERLLKGYRNIYIVGHLPRWCTNVVHIKHSEYHPKANNIHDKVAAACKHPDITDDFILFNDDYFLVQAVDAPIYPYYYSDSALDEVMTRPKADPYRRLVVDTYSEINTARYYDIHCPIVINKEAFLSQTYNRKYEGGILVKTSYCAHFQPVNSIKRADPILRDKHTIEEIRAIELTTDLISIHDTAINPDLIEWIETKYPYPSSYEK
jgi:glycosyltransferase involved in cell wall biosynthesis